MPPSYVAARLTPVPVERIRARVATREGSTPSKLLDAIKAYAAEPSGPWAIVTRRPLVLMHLARRGKGVRFAFARDEGGITMVVSGASARLAVGYAVTMLVSPRFDEHVATIELRPPGGDGARRGRR